MRHQGYQGPFLGRVKPYHAGSQHSARRQRASPPSDITLRNVSSQGKESHHISVLFRAGAEAREGR